jgi:hypothetical protein
MGFLRKLRGGALLRSPQNVLVVKRRSGGEHFVRLRRQRLKKDFNKWSDK